MIKPIKYKERVAINSLTGIKPSLQSLRSVVALVYLLYLANGKKAEVSYSIPNNDGISLKPEYLLFIKKYLNDDSIEQIIKNNPLLLSQIEAVYVGVTLMFGLGRISFENKNFGMSSERTGRKRYPKVIDYASKIIVLDAIIQGVEDNIKIKFLSSWIKNESDNSELEQRVISFLNIAMENNLFKIRSNDGDLFFQTEGIYLALQKDEAVSWVSEEKVGPVRILNSMLKEGLIPWLKINNNAICLNPDSSFDVSSYSKMLSTSLDIRDIKVDAVEEISTNDNSQEKEPESPYQQLIYYGTPGSGKSWKIKQQYEMKIVGNDYVEDDAKKKHVIRTTFHPDTDYASFVGCYKPIRNNNDNSKITYEFVPQAFTDAYIKAWGNPGENYYLVIEEINRGNCAQIFGDLFQLLDRKRNGYSEYPIKADNDLKQHLEKELGVGHPGIKDGELCLPPNLSIIASMNTSDQSLFPMDSAFKRRWTWEYVPINYKEPKSSGFNLNISGDNPFKNWIVFLQKINKIILEKTDSEDKQMGNFFIKGDVDADEFKNKVMFYLWSELCKDLYHTNDNFFRADLGGDTPVEFSFNKLYESDGDDYLIGFLKYIHNYKLKGEKE